MKKRMLSFILAIVLITAVTSTSTIAAGDEMLAEETDAMPSEEMQIPVEEREEGAGEGEEGSEETNYSFEIESFTNEAIMVEVERGTEVADIPLPETLSAIDREGNEIEVPVTWTAPKDEEASSCGMDGYTYGSISGYGPWTFIAVVDSEYSYDGEPVEAQVFIPSGFEIDSFTNEAIMVEVERGTEVADIPLPETLSAIDREGNEIEVPVTWTAPEDEEASSWEMDGYTYESVFGYGPWTFTAVVDSKYTYDGAPIEAQVSIPDCNEIDRFINEAIMVEVERGTEVADIPLPETLSAIDREGNEIEVPVTWTAPEDEEASSWEMDGYTYGSVFGYGPWTFTAVVDSKYTYDGAPIEAQVSIPDCNEIASLCGQCSNGLLFKFPISIGKDPELSAITYTGAMMADGGYKNVPVTISGSYDNEKEGTYRLSVNIGGDYTGVPSAYAEVVVCTYE